MKKLLLSVLAMAAAFGAGAESVTATWELSNPDKLAAADVSVSQTSAANLSVGFTLGSKIAGTRAVGSCTGDTGFDGATFTPAFTAFKPATKVTAKTDGYCVSFTVTPAAGHSFLPRTIAFDAMKVGTDGGSVDVYYKTGNGAETAITTGVSPLRNKITASNSTGFSHHEFSLADVLADGQPFTLTLYIMGINGDDSGTSAKEIAFRNVTVKGGLDEKATTVSDHLSAFGCAGALSLGKVEKIDLLPLVKNLKNGETAAYPSKLFGDPKDFTFTAKEGYSAAVSYEGHTVSVAITKGGDAVLDFGVRFTVTNRQSKPKAKPLNRGLMSLSLTGAKMGTGNLVSWRHREADGYGVKYKLYRGDATDQTDALCDGLYITDRTNILDADGSADSYYRLETYNAWGRLLSTEVSRKTWSDQTFRIPLETPLDKVNGATYTPNDASYCDMDGDGEYEIILKWSPSNEKDAASTGTTSPAIFDCLKLDGTRLWRINAGPNFFTSAHTMQFIAWDFDGDGYGEFMMKTAPGTIDGEGNYVLLGNDDPNENLLSSRGKQDHGSEYITVFDGLTGGELATIPYHTAYGDVTTSIWGDSNQNRSERYLAGLAYLDGPDANPSPIFARGYYKGAFVAAYDWDGTTLKERWVSRNTTSGKGLWGEGAHWMACGDCDGDGKQEIVYGSAALDHDGSLLYRTGLGHGDSLHLGDFLPDRPGLEVYMVHEEGSYGCDLRDAATGQLLIRETASSDTGRGIAAHFDTTADHSQYTHSADPGMHSCLTKEKYSEGWNPGGGGSMNNRIYWTGNLYDEHYDKSCLAQWHTDTEDPTKSGFWRIQVNKTNYTIGTLNNSSKYNPCVLGDLLGDWREEIVLWGDDADGNRSLIINATSFETEYRIPHLMDDLNYRVQLVNQNCCYNQPPHLSVDPSRVYAANPNHAEQEDRIDEEPGVEEPGVEDPGVEDPGETAVINAAAEGADVIYTATGLRIREITAPGLYIVNGKKLIVR